jgi:hypothetical protein
MAEKECSDKRCDHRKGRTTSGHCTHQDCENYVNKCAKHRTDLPGNTMKTGLKPGQTTRKGIPNKPKKKAEE